MEETLLALLTAHFLGDFLFQNKWMVDKKKQWWVLLLHVAIITITSFVLLGNFHPPLLLGVFGSHLIFDKIKISLKKDKWQYFVVDQIAHVIALVALSYFCRDVPSNCWWPKLIAGSYLPWFHAAQCFTTGFVVVVPAGGILIGKLTAPISEEIKKSKIVQTPSDQAPNSPSDYLTEGLSNGGMYIGWLERFLTMILILIGHPTGIGFLIAAKSILRFGEIKESRHRKLAEYIIIGTFLSFGWALLMSVATKKSIDHWLPVASQKPEPVRVIIEQRPPVTPSLTPTKPTSADQQNETQAEPLRPPSKSGGAADNDNTATNDAANKKVVAPAKDGDPNDVGKDDN